MQILMKITSTLTQEKSAERQKTSFPKKKKKKNGRKCRIVQNLVEQNNDLTRIMCETQFRSSFNFFPSL